jgi:hypothetical protein
LSDGGGLIWNRVRSGWEWPLKIKRDLEMLTIWISCQIRCLILDLFSGHWNDETYFIRSFWEFGMFRSGQDFSSLCKTLLTFLNSILRQDLQLKSYLRLGVYY